MKIPEELIDHLEHEINMGNVDKKVQNIIMLIAEQNKKYKEVIDKAREYVEKHLTDKGRFLMLNEWQVPDLLDILKEV